jgi:hypothetical protein
MTSYLAAATAHLHRSQLERVEVAQDLDLQLDRQLEKRKHDEAWGNAAAADE